MGVCGSENIKRDVLSCGSSNYKKSKILQKMKENELLLNEREKRAYSLSLISISDLDERETKPYSTTPNPDNNSINIKVFATIGETEYPIYFKKDDKIVINIGEANFDEKSERCSEWSFLSNEAKTLFSGYPNIKYNGKNLGCLILRITGSNKKLFFSQEQSSFHAWESGNLLMSSNLNPIDYLIYKPEGFLNINIIGGKGINYKEDMDTIYSELPKFNFIEESNEEKIIRYINIARKDFIKYIKDYIDDISLIKEYSKKEEEKNYYKSLKILQNNKNLRISAKEHWQDLNKNKTSGHTGSDNNSYKKRIEKYSPKIKSCGESIVYGINNPLLLVNSLIKDKYSKRKENLNNIIDKRFTKIGVFLGEHPIYRFCCVIVYGN